MDEDDDDKEDDDDDKEGEDDDDGDEVFRMLGRHTLCQVYPRCGRCRWMKMMMIRRMMMMIRRVRMMMMGMKFLGC